MIDLVPKLDDPAVPELLAFCMGHPTPAKIQATCEKYRHQPQWKLLGMQGADRIVGCIGIELVNDGQAVVRCIAVTPAFRKQNIGRTLIDDAVRHFRLYHLTAETDAEAVEFYRSCGFAITSLGEIYPGTERFRCVLQRG